MLYMSYLGEFIYFMVQVCYSILMCRFPFIPFLLVVFDFLISSFFLIFLCSFFLGIVLTWQAYAKFSNYGLEASIGSFVCQGGVIEVIPLMISLILSGRMSSLFASNIGSMKISEQLDALTIMGIKHIDYIVAPKVIGAIVSAPIVNLVSFFCFFFGATVLVFMANLMPFSFFISSSISSLSIEAFYIGSLKATLFSFIYTTLSCFIGLKTKNGAEGIGESVTSSVVISSVIILLCNCVLSFFIRL